MKHLTGSISLLIVLIICVNAKTFCPSANDFVVAYGNPSLFDQGWKNSGNGGVATKAAFNLLGGSVDYDIDLSDVDTGINANVYTVSPKFSGQYNHGRDYCDAQKGGDQWCVEIDWIETNGNCGGQTTIHTRPGGGNNGCTAWGCHATYRYNGKTSFHMRIEYDASGEFTTFRNGVRIEGGNMDPKPQGQDWGELKRQYQSRGAVIVSTLWQGWVPMSECGNGGNLGGSSFTVRNLKIEGTVVNGPEPRACAGGASRPTPDARPTPRPAPRPTPPAPRPTPPAPRPAGCAGITQASDPNNRYWIEVNAPQNARVSVICSNGAQKDINVACSWNWGKHTCNSNGQECLPDANAPRFAVVNGQRCRLNRQDSNAVADFDDSVDATFTDAAIADSVDATFTESADSVDATFTDAALDAAFAAAFTDAAVADAVDAGFADATFSDSVVDVAFTDAAEEEAAFADAALADAALADAALADAAFDGFGDNQDLDAALAADSQASLTTSSNDSTPGFAIALIVIFSIMLVALLAIVVLNAMHLRRY